MVRKVADAIKNNASKKIPHKILAREGLIVKGLGQAGKESIKIKDQTYSLNT